MRAKVVKKFTTMAEAIRYATACERKNRRPWQVQYIPAQRVDRTWVVERKEDER